MLGIAYMRLVLGVNDVSSSGLGYLAHIFYNFGLIYIGLIIGSVVAVLFVVLDVFYLKKRLTISLKSTVIRLLLLILITTLVGAIHYFLEKIIDVI